MADARHRLNDEDSPHGRSGDLYSRAEELLDAMAAGDSTPQDAAGALHELRVNQIELEMQNEELRRAHLQLDEQRAKYFDLFDLAPVGYLTLSDNGIVESANLTSAHLLGVDRQMLVGKPFSAFVFKDDRDAYYLHMVALHRSTTPLTFELRLQTKSGESGVESDHFWALLETSPRPTTAGDARAWWVAFTDISDRKHAEQSLLESDSALQAILSSAADGLLAVDEGGKVLFTNERFVELWRIPRELLAIKDDPALLACVLDQLVDPSAFAEKVQELHDSDAESFDTLTFKDGRVFERLSRPLFWGAQLHGRVWSFRDITERKRAEAMVVESANRYQMLMDSASDGLHVLDEQGNVVEANEAFCEMLGYSKDEMHQINVADWTLEWGGDELHLKIAELIAQPAVIETEVRRKDGAIRLFEIHCSGIKLHGRDCLYASAQDITDRKAAEKKHVERIERAANVDRLTGLHNLRGFELVAEQSIAQAVRSSQGIGLIFCDLDGLKTINDEFGHIEGDRALKDVASVLESTLRLADAIARIGGDEFVVLAVQDRPEDLAYLNERLQAGFDSFNAANERPYLLSVSSGTGWCERGAACRLDELRAAADTEMYAEKERRRGIAGGLAS